MRIFIIGSILVVAVLAFSPGMAAQTAAQSGATGADATLQTPDGKPDLSGIWYRPTRFLGFSEEEPPMQPAVEEKYKTWKVARGILSEIPPIACLSFGMPRIYFARSPFEIFQVPGRVIMIFEAFRQARIIYTDGRGHPEGAPDSFMGHSIGKWDGDTLVVETTGFYGEGKSLVDRSHPHSDALRVVERFQRVNYDTLEIDVLIDDPQVYTKPWGGKMPFELEPDWELMESFTCIEDFEKKLPEMFGAAKDD